MRYSSLPTQWTPHIGGSPDIVEVGQLSQTTSYSVVPVGAAFPIQVFGFTASLLRKTVESTRCGHRGISRY